MLVATMGTTTKHDIKADFILDEGMKILWAKGYHATSVNDIVKSANIPKGSFYFYFDSKEDFALKALERYFSIQVKPAFKIFKNTNASPKQRLIDFYEFRITTLKEGLKCKMGCLASNVSTEMSDHNEKIRNVIYEKSTSIKKEIVKVAKEAQELGEINPSMNIPDMIEFIEDACRGAMVTMREMQSSYPLDNCINVVKNILFN